MLIIQVKYFYHWMHVPSILKVVQIHRKILFSINTYFRLCPINKKNKKIKLQINVHAQRIIIMKIYSEAFLTQS
jgi:hypothetical protein